MDIILDLLVALIIVGMLLLLTLQLDANVKTHVMVIRQMNAANMNLAVIGEILEYDLRKIGHGLIVPQNAITLAESSRIIFAYDKNPFAAYDSIKIEYSVRANGESPNLSDMVLSRRVNNSRVTDMAMGVTRFSLKYYNQAGVNLPRPVPADSLSKIKVIQLDMLLQSTEPIKDAYQSVSYHTKITPKNLLIRYGR